MFPKCFKALLFRGKLFLKLKESVKAEEDFKTALETNQASLFWAHFHLAESFELQKRHEESLGQIEHAKMKLKNSSLQILSMVSLKKAKLLISLGRLDEARWELQEIKDFEAVQAQIYYQLGKIHRKTGKF